MKVQFEFSPRRPETVNEVFLVGSFNSWNKGVTPMKPDEKRRLWRHSLEVPEGFYPYKFLVNGVDWHYDWKAKRFEQNELGSLNSLAMVTEKKVVHATFSPLGPTCSDEITIYSEKPASLLWSVNGWHPCPRGYLKNTVPNLEVNVQQMEEDRASGRYKTTIGPFNMRKVPEVIVYTFVYPDGTVDDNYGKNYWIPIDLALEGECRIDSFKSKALAADRPFRVYMPPRGRGDQKFPLLILLHGYGGSHLADWLQVETVKMLAERYGIILIWVDGNVWVWGETIPSWYINSPKAANALMEDYIIKELIPYAEAAYPVSGQRAIGGISMGGFGSLYLATRYPGTFRAAASFSAIYNLYRYRRIDALRKLVGDENSWKKNQFNVIKLVSGAKDTDFFFLVGDEERGALRDNFNLKLAMDKAGIRNEFRIYPGNHTNNFWRIHLQEMMEFFARQLGCVRTE
ncbi:MAG: alpha/beta hydrolase-fold protein [Candidatus Eremiobacteraeota bacterium]|nr:alpha/beta hydrolase-fold protein [Candidatus Eremiobacteraeota bacterium]